MIDFSVEAKGKCKNCPYMDLDVEAHNVYAYGKLADRAISVKCEHESLCYHLEQYLKDFQEQEEKDAQDKNQEKEGKPDSRNCWNCINFNNNDICPKCIDWHLYQGL